MDFLEKLYSRIFGDTPDSPEVMRNWNKLLDMLDRYVSRDNNIIEQFHDTGLALCLALRIQGFTRGYTLAFELIQAAQQRQGELNL